MDGEAVSPASKSLWKIIRRGSSEGSWKRGKTKKESGVHLMILEWKVPRITVEEMLYGEYLRRNSNMLPAKDVDLSTKGFLVTATDYGDPENTNPPFIVGDWIEEDYAKKNFREISR